MANIVMIMSGAVLVAASINTGSLLAAELNSEW